MLCSGELKKALSQGTRGHTAATTSPPPRNAPANLSTQSTPKTTRQPRNQSDPPQIRQSRQETVGEPARLGAETELPSHRKKEIDHRSKRLERGKSARNTYEMRREHVPLPAARRPAASFPPRFAPRQGPLSLSLSLSLSLKGSSSLQPRLVFLLSCWPLSLLCLLTTYFSLMILTPCLVA